MLFGMEDRLKQTGASSGEIKSAERRDLTQEEERWRKAAEDQAAAELKQEQAAREQRGETAITAGEEFLRGRLKFLRTPLAPRVPALEKEQKKKLDLAKVLPESAGDAEKRAAAAKASQEALAKAAADAKTAASRSALMPAIPLVNVGSTCFANATLQCLFQLPSLQTMVLGLGDVKTWKPVHPLEQQSINFIAQYQYLVIALQSWTPSTAFTPITFCTTMRTRVFGGARGSQDAAQFFSAFTDDLGDLKGKTPFDIAVNSTIVCHECEESSAKTETEHYLALSIAGGTLKDCLAQYMQGEELTGTEQYRCSYCNAKHDATKTLKVTSLPDILVLQLKRYTGTTAITKNTTPVSFPLVLDQANFYQGDEKAAGVVYDLVGMVNHNEPGHYTAYVKSSSDGIWRFCDDTKIAERTSDQVKAVADAGVDKVYREATPYLLFYLRRSAAASSSAA
jgi:ubiquitin C-terminal hydrolase